jgi:hypothetical protein
MQVKSTHKDAREMQLSLTFRLMQEMPRLNLGNGRIGTLVLEGEDASPGPYVGRINFQRPIVVRERCLCVATIGECRTNSIIQQPILGIVSIRYYYDITRSSRTSGQTDNAARKQS